MSEQRDLASHLANGLDLLARGKASLFEKPRARIECAEVRNGISPVIGYLDMADKILSGCDGPLAASTVALVAGYVQGAKEGALALRTKCHAEEKSNREKPSQSFE